MWIERENQKQLSKLFKKLKVLSRKDGRREGRYKKAEPTNYFNELDWKSWLEYVKEFVSNERYKEASRSSDEIIAEHDKIRNDNDVMEGGHKNENSFVEVNVKVEEIRLGEDNIKSNYSSHDGRPYVRIGLFENDLLALVDSGATRCVIGGPAVYLLEKYKLYVNKSDNYRATTADNYEQEVLGSVELPIFIGGNEYLVYFLVIPSIQISCILGADFQIKYGFTFDLRLGKWFMLSSEGDLCGYASAETREINLSGLKELTMDEHLDLEKVIKCYDELGNKGLGRTNKMVYSIDTGDAKPIKQRYYSLSPYMQEYLNKELDSMLEAGVVRPSSSPWSSPVLLVKKSNGEYRFCFDGRALNSVTKKDAYPLPKINSILSKLGQANYISSIDLNKAFWQIPLDEESSAKTAFVVPGRGLFEFTVVPFGLANAAQCQQKLMQNVLGYDLEPSVFVYLDDVIIVSENFESHMKMLNEVYKRLKNANLTVNRKKCEFCRDSLKYLGFIIDKTGLKTDPEKVECMVNYPIPKNTTQVKRFLGMCSWYRRFIKNFATVVEPINALLRGRKKGQGIAWSEEADVAFNKIKTALVSSPVLASPDFTKEFTIQCDASDVGIGAVLTQEINGEEHVIGYASRPLSNSERKYSATQKECLALVFAVEKFRMYIEGVRFKVIVDHYSLLWLRRLKDPIGMLSRWALKLDQYDMELIHRKGKLHVVPDALSRIPAVLNMINVSDSDYKKDTWYTSMIDRVNKNPDSYSLWRVENGILYKYVTTKFWSCVNSIDWKMVVPRNLRQEVLQQCHDSPLAAHMGFKKTYSRISEEYYWPQMRRDILTYINKCQICSSQKSPNKARPGLMGKEKEVNYPFQLISMDLMGPLPRSSKGNTYLLVVTDWYSKYVLLHPLRQATTNGICKFIEEQVFLIYGVPQVIVVDNGSQFVSKKFKSLCKEYFVKNIWYNASYHPQINFTERTNRTVGTAIRSYIADGPHKKWDENLAKIGWALRSAVNEVTKYSPNQLVFGRLVPTDGRFYGPFPKGNVKAGDRDILAGDLTEMQELRNEICKRLNYAYKRNSHQYNLRKREVKYELGDLVWKKNYTLSKAAEGFAAKLAPKYILCKIIKVNSSLVYTLEDMHGKEVGRWHVKDLKPYFGDNEEKEVQDE